MNRVRFGDMIGVTQESRRKPLNDFMNQIREKKAKALEEKREELAKNPKAKKSARIYDDNGVEIKPKRKKSKGKRGRPALLKEFKLSKKHTINITYGEDEMLKLMMDCEEAKKYRITKPFFFRKIIHLLFYEFFNDEENFIDKFNDIQMFEENVNNKDNTLTENNENVTIGKETEKQEDIANA